MLVFDIFYIATGVYCEYFPKFLETLPFFFPDIEKRVSIISDALKEYDGYSANSITIRVIHQLDLPYPIIPLLKTHFIKNYLPFDAEYVFYFDADTIFFKKDKKYWENLYNVINMGEVLLAEHPGGYYPSHELNEESECFICRGIFFFPIISSFFGGKKEKMITFLDEVNKKISHDLTYHKNNHPVHYIPPLFDQDYITKLQLEPNGLSFYIKYFVSISWLRNDLDIVEDNFIEQKYDISKKFKKKNML